MNLPISILLVDDQARNVVALEAALSSLDCSLVTAGSGLDALKRMLAHDFAVIVLDIHMPGMDGFEAARLIRARERSQLTPIIFLTADRAEARVLEGYRLGAVDYIYTPFDPDILRSKVSFFVELYRKTAALEQRTAELNTMATELERRVIERTAALEVALSDLRAEVAQAEFRSAALQRSEKLRALGQMASGIAHDLNQSLMLVASYSDLARHALLEDPPDLAELADLLTTTTQAALDGGATVRRLLLFTRGAPELDNQLVDLSVVIREAAQMTAPHWRDAGLAQRRPINLIIEAAGHPTVQGSPGGLRELMTNLIFNAVDALPTGGTIRLWVAAENGRGVMEITDSGAGMTPEVQARVFEPFFTTKGEGGTGLGLAMAFGIVEQHHGHIDVRSAPGDGTTFRMTFPLMDAVVEAEPSPPSSSRLEPQRPLRVLAVDDEPMMTRAVARMLKPAGHVVSAAASGEEALERLAEQPFDVVVSDMGMGAGMNGWELAEAVKSRWPGVRFMLATGWGAALDPEEVRTRGIDAVLSKPYRTDDLVRALAGTDMAA